jgi:hypothetical protein
MTYQTGHICPNRWVRNVLYKYTKINYTKRNRITLKRVCSVCSASYAFFANISVTPILISFVKLLKQDAYEGIALVTRNPYVGIT